MNTYLVSTLLLIAGVSLQAQTEQIRRAVVSGSGGNSGKCTIEVRVDISAEVDIYGDSGRLRTLAGQPATWTRFECTDGLPYSMSDFRFHGIDGRGSVKLVQDPRNNNGIATIRIDDPKGGAEGYTFDVEWSGAKAAAPTGGFPAYPSNGRYGGTRYPGRGMNRNFSVERAIDLCRNEVRTRAQRDFGLSNIDITSAGMDSASGRQDLVTGSFTDRAYSFRRGAGYRFACSVDYSSGQVRSVDFMRSDGTAMRPGTSAYGTGAYDQNRVLRSCQDAVVSRINRDGYENVRFGSTTTDRSRAEWTTGTVTASRGSVTDTFDFSCQMDLTSAQVRQVKVNRR